MNASSQREAGLGGLALSAAPFMEWYMDKSLTSTHGTAPPGARPRGITLGQIPRYAELYRKTGKPPRVNVKKPWRFDCINLPTRERWVLKLSDSRTFLLKPGTNRFDPPIRLEAGAWFIIHMASRSSGCVQLPIEGLSGWIDEDDVFNSLLTPDDPSDRDATVEPVGAANDEELAPTELHALDEAAQHSEPAPVPLEQAVESTPLPASTHSPTFTFGRTERTEWLFARFRRRMFSRAAA